MNINEIRSKLQHGKTINEVCKEYQLTFQQLFQMLKGEIGVNIETPPTGVLYISLKRKGQMERYILKKGKNYYATFYSLEDAIKVRDYFIYNGWRKDKVDKVCEELGVIRCKDVGRRW